MAYFIMGLVACCINTVLIYRAIKSGALKKGSLSVVAGVVIITLYVASIGIPYACYVMSSETKSGTNKLMDALDL